MSDLDRLFYWCGIAADYLNYRGEHTPVPIQNRISLLDSMGVDVSTPEKIAEEAYRLDVEPWQHLFPKLVVAPAGDRAFFELNIKPSFLNEEFSWMLKNSQGNIIKQGAFYPNERDETGEYLFEGVRYSRRKVMTGAIEPNYYTLDVTSKSVSESTVLACYPEQMLPDQLVGDQDKVWGVIIQLYTLTSGTNWGIGDFTDLSVLIEKLADNGADVVGLNPLHALSTDLEKHYSPYSPSDRRFINPLYIDVTSLPEYNEISDFVDKALVDELRHTKAVVYTKVRDLKYSVLEKIFDKFILNSYINQDERQKSFTSFIKTFAHSLLAFAYYEARNQNWVNASYVIDDSNSFEDATKGLTGFSKELSGSQKSVLFHCFLQWLADIQLEECHTLAKNKGMKIGLIRDLAVGADGAGSEVTSNENLFCRKSAIGAPPDPLAQTGQNWGLPPVIPSELRKSGFIHLIELFRSNMRHCGALRIDHAMSLMRLWWCPPAKTADHGAYVYYPFVEMLGLLALESYLSQCVIIGEDLGVVPVEFRSAIEAAKIFTNKVFYFEKKHGDVFKNPEEYEEHALAMVNNHDVPTLLSWWNGTDLELRNNLNLLEKGVAYEDVCAARAHEKKQLLAMLYDHGVYPTSWHGQSVDKEADADLIHAILLLLSKTRSQIFVLQLEDLILMDEPVNVPGTFKEHPNWQRKLSMSLDEIFSNKNISSLLKTVSSNRKR